MITTDTTNKLGTTVAKDLRTVMQGKVAIAGEASYGGARRVFNGAVDRRPTLFAFCENARDLQKAVRAARAYGLPLSVRGGGHDWAGRALSHQGLVVDLSRMRQVEVDVRGRVASVAGGALAGDVVAAAGSPGFEPAPDQTRRRRRSGGSHAALQAGPRHTEFVPTRTSDPAPSLRGGSPEEDACNQVLVHAQTCTGPRI